MTDKKAVVAPVVVPDSDEPSVLAPSARAVQVRISAQAMKDAAKLWPLLDKDRLNQTFPGWLQAMTLLTKTYHAQSSAAAGRSYIRAREAAASSPAPTDVVKLADPPSDEWIAKAFGFSGPGLLSRDTAQPNTALSTTLGTTSRIVRDGGRSTARNTVQGDKFAVGWYRLTDSHPCSFCALLASRGAVYKNNSFNPSNRRFEGDGDFKVHNLCDCELVPIFARDEQLPPMNQAAQQVYDDVVRELSGPRNQANVLPAFRKAWEAHLASLDAAS